MLLMQNSSYTRNSKTVCIYDVESSFYSHQTIFQMLKTIMNINVCDILKVYL